MSGDNDILSNEDVNEEGQKVDPVLEALERVMQTEDGRTVLWDIVSGAGMFANSFSTDSHSNAHNSGMRTVATHLWQEMGIASIENRVKMMQEGTSE